MSGHVVADLPSLLTGELPLGRAAEVVDHLHRCEACRSELVLTAGAHGALLASARALPAAVGAAGGGEQTGGEPAGERRQIPPRLPPLARSGRRPTRRVVAVAAAAAVLAALGLGTVGVLPGTRPAGGGQQVQQATQQAILQPTGGSAARGVVTMRRPGGGADMTVSTSGLSAPGPKEFYEVWLFDPRTAKMVGIGVLAPDGRGSFRVPAGLVSAYGAVDVSLQRDNGDPRHSELSVLRGRYS